MSAIISSSPDFHWSPGPAYRSAATVPEASFLGSNATRGEDLCRQSPRKRLDFYIPSIQLRFQNHLLLAYHMVGRTGGEEEI